MKHPGYDRQYFPTLRDMLGAAKQASVAVAFWGAGGELIFKHWQGKSLRVICNLTLGGTNPAVIPKLQELNGAEVRQMDELHAKLVLTDKQMVVGSANVSTNGLGLEDKEAAVFMELGVLSTDALLLVQAGDWFYRLWERSCRIDDADLAKAKEAWCKRRTNRPVIRTKKSLGLIDQPAEALKDRLICFAVYREGLSSVAKERLHKENKKLARSPHPEHAKLDAYEGWGAKDLKDPSAVIIPIYWGPRGGVKVYQAQRPVPDLKDSHMVEGEDGGESVATRLDYTAFVKDPSILDLPFSLTAADREALKELIGEWLRSTGQQIEEQGGYCVLVYEFMKWRQTMSC